MELLHLLFDDSEADNQSDSGPGESENVGNSDLLTAPRRRLKLETEMDITPMIDITFLLLIFFLVAARIDDNSSVELPVAKNGEAITVDDSAVLTVIPEGDGVVVFMGERTDESARISTNDELEQNDRIVDYVTSELKADVPKRQVLIRASKGIKYRQIARIITSAGAAEGAEVYMAVIEE